MKTFRIISCVDTKNGMGKNGTLPWKNKEEMKHFQKTTLNSIVIMGRKTYESLPKKLAERWNVVISSQNKIQGESPDETFSSLVDALEHHKHSDADIYVIGGAELIKEAICISKCEDIILSKIDGDYMCDVFFPEIKPEWKVTSCIENHTF